MTRSLKLYGFGVETEGIRLNDIFGGAAGGAGAGVGLFANAKLKSGIDTVLDMVCFEEKARNKQLIITGEGRTDSQGLDGKAVIGIARRAKSSAFRSRLSRVIWTMIYPGFMTRSRVCA